MPVERDRQRVRLLARAARDAQDADRRGRRTLSRPFGDELGQRVEQFMPAAEEPCLGDCQLGGESDLLRRIGRHDREIIIGRRHADRIRSLLDRQGKRGRTQGFGIEPEPVADHRLHAGETHPVTPAAINPPDPAATSPKQRVGVENPKNAGAVRKCRAQDRSVGLAGRLAATVPFEPRGCRRPAWPVTRPAIPGHCGGYGNRMIRLLR